MLLLTDFKTINVRLELRSHNIFHSGRPELLLSYKLKIIIKKIL